MNKMSYEEFRKLVDENIMTSAEAIDYFNFSRARLNELVKEGRIEPLRRGVYFKPELENIDWKRKDIKMNEK